MASKRKPGSGRRPSPHPPITARELARVRAEGPDALRWQRRFGLAKARQLCTGLVVAGAVPFLGLLVFGWNVAAMMVYLAIDVAAVLLADLVRLLLAGAALRETHAQDHRAQQIMSIVGGLEDGTNTWVDHGRGLGPVGLYGVALGCTLVAVPVGAAVVEALGAVSLREAIAVPWFREFALGSVALHLLQAFAGAFGARRMPPGEQSLTLDCGGVIGLFLGLLVLVWLPVVWGANGIVAMLAIVFVFKLAFGGFALYWVPRVTRALQRFLETPPASA